MSKNQRESATSPQSQFGLRTLLAIIAGLALVFWLLGILIRNSAWSLVVMVMFWAIGSFLGMWGRQRGRTLLGSIVGGCLPVIAFLVVYVCVQRNVPFSSMPLFFVGWIGIGIGASSILALVVGILREGITISNVSEPNARTVDATEQTIRHEARGTRFENG